MADSDLDPRKMMETWFRDRPELASIRAGVVDLNGCLRGKRLPAGDVGKVLGGTMRMPLSVSAQDVWGRDVADNPLILSGDGDGICRATGRAPLVEDWHAAPSALIPMWMWDEDGGPSPIDPRQALAAVVARYHRLGLRPVVATEMEFYLTDRAAGAPAAPVSPVTGQRLSVDGVLSLDDLDQFEGFLSEVYRLCAGNGIPVETAIAEGGPGQFEINLTHVEDALAAADDAFLFKRLVKGVARRMGFAASFMAKPFLDRAGSGLHVHFSVLDGEGRNIFDDGSAEGSGRLGSAVAGLLAAMPAQTLVFAPHRNSYRRLEPGSHAPTHVSWAYENRFAAVRIPGGAPEARRIEHRVAGADANPYLVVAAILGAALAGLEAELPVPAVDAGDGAAPRLPATWGEAVAAFAAAGPELGGLPAALCETFVLCKRQEMETFAARMTDFEVQTYLETV